MFTQNFTEQELADYNEALLREMGILMEEVEVLRQREADPADPWADDADEAAIAAAEAEYDATVNR